MLVFLADIAVNDALCLFSGYGGILTLFLG